MKNIDETVGFLRECPAFCELKADEQRALAYLLRDVVVEDGDWLFSEGDVGNEAYLVMEGVVEIVHVPRSGKERVRAVLGRGELFGELALFGTGRRAAGARARGRVRLGAIEFRSFVPLIQTWPAIALALLRLQTTRFLELEGQHRHLLGDR